MPSSAHFTGSLVFTPQAGCHLWAACGPWGYPFQWGQSYVAPPDLSLPVGDMSLQLGERHKGEDMQGRVCQLLLAPVHGAGEEGQTGSG